MYKAIETINKYQTKIVKFFVVISIISFTILVVSSVYPQNHIQGLVVKKLGSGYDRNTNRGRIIIKKKNGRTFKLINEDNLLLRKYNKTKKYQQNLQIGKKYSFEIVGISIPILGIHPNIIKYRIIK